MLLSEKYFGLSERITSWKEISDFESALAEKAAHDADYRKLYANYYESLNPEYYLKGKVMAHKLFNQVKPKLNGIDFETIYTDMVYCLHKFGFSFEDYYAFQLYYKNEKGKSQYISDKLRYYYCDILNAPGLKEIMNNKYLCYSTYKHFYKREILLINSTTTLQDFKSFIQKYPKFIYKPLSEHSGHGIEIIDSGSIDIIKWFFEISKNHSGVVEELILQGKELSRLNPSSVNTCRVITFRIDKTVDIFLVCLRMSQGGNIVDNTGAGGIIVDVDCDTGIVKGEGFDFAFNRYLYHPLSKTILPGFQLPEWDNAKKLITDMALHVNGTTLVGWDIAYSNKGWVMVEANENSAWTGEQLCHGMGLKNELFSFMDKYFNNNNS